MEGEVGEVGETIRGNVREMRQGEVGAVSGNEERVNKISKGK